jgi:cell wall assembly regulator SMI1
MALNKLETLLKNRNDINLGGGITNYELTNLEKKLEVAFHPDLIDYLMKFGWLEIGHLEFFGYGKEIPAYLNILEITESERNESHIKLPRNYIPLLNDGAGNLYCIDVMKDSATYGQIVFWDHDLRETQAPEVYALNLENWLIERLESLD